MYSITCNSSNLPNINIFCETSIGLIHSGVFDIVTDGVLVIVNVKVGVIVLVGVGVLVGVWVIVGDWVIGFIAVGSKNSISGSIDISLNSSGNTISLI